MTAPADGAPGDPHEQSSSGPSDANGGAAAAAVAQARTSLRFENPLAYSLLQALPEPALLVSADGVILAVNGAAVTLLGAPPAELQGAPLASRIMDDSGKVSEYLAACSRTRSPLPGAFRGPSRTEEASRLVMHGGAVLPGDGAGAGAGAIVLLRVTRREAASSRFTLLNRQLLELTKEIRARRLAESALQAANAQLSDQTVELELANQQLQNQTAELEQQFEEASSITEQLERTNEQLRVANDALREQSAAAEAANRAKSEFLAMMSHELRTPLNAIGGYVEILDLGIRGPVTDAQREDLHRIGRSQRHLLSLINQVLNFARLEAGQVFYNMATIDVDALLLELEPLIAPQVRSQRLRYSYDRTRTGISAWADRDKVEQVLLNLLSNAIKFTHPGGAITIGCEPEETTVAISVTDTGVGITAEKLDRIFEPFVQIDPSLTRASDGVGLGLAISRDLARGMGGDLVVSSVPGAGSTFMLKLPVDPPSSA